MTVFAHEIKRNETYGDDLISLSNEKANTALQKWQASEELAQKKLIRNQRIHAINLIFVAHWICLVCTVTFSITLLFGVPSADMLLHTFILSIVHLLVSLLLWWKNVFIGQAIFICVMYTYGVKIIEDNQWNYLQFLTVVFALSSFYLFVLRRQLVKKLK